MNRIIRLMFALLLYCGLCAAVQPVALSVLADGNLVALSRDNALYLIEARTGAIKKVAEFPLAFQVVDLAGGGTPGEGWIFAAMRTRAKVKQLSPVVRFSIAGKELDRWTMTNGEPSAMAFDAAKRTVYITTLQGSSIYTINPEDKNHMARYVAEVGGAKRLGAIALNPVTGQLFVADIFEGTIFQLLPPSYKSSPLVGNLGEPSALALGPGGRTLYIADRTSRAIWTVALGATNPAVTKFWSSPELKLPEALAVTNDGTVWVGDSIGRAIFSVNPDGKQVRVLR